MFFVLYQAKEFFKKYIYRVKQAIEIREDGNCLIKSNSSIVSIEYSIKSKKLENHLWKKE